MDDSLTRFLGALIAVAVIGALLVIAVGRAAPPTVYGVDDAHQVAIDGAVRNHEGCVRYTSVRPVRLACQPTGQALQRQADRLTAAMQGAAPRPNVPCTVGRWLPAQRAAIAAAKSAGRQRAASAFQAWRALEAHAEAIEDVCTRAGRR